jgi:hypothetical protein
VASLGCSAQARSYRDKPRPPLGATCVINPKPVLFRKADPPQVFHPVPIALSEICKLCEIDQSAGVGDLELVGQTCRVPLGRFASTDTQGLTSPGRSPSREMGCVIQRDTVLVASRLRKPLFEVLKPSVVIRRRPQRPYPAHSVLRSAINN